MPGIHSPCRSALTVLLFPVFHAAFPVEFFLAEYRYPRGTGHGWPVQPDAARRPLKGGPQQGRIPAILLRKIHRNKCMEDGEQKNRQSTPTGASSFNNKQFGCYAIPVSVITFPPSNRYCRKIQNRQEFLPPIIFGWQQKLLPVRSFFMIRFRIPLYQKT